MSSLSEPRAGSLSKIHSNFISVKMGILKPEIRDEIRNFLKNIWKDFSINDLDIDKFRQALSKDKKISVMN